MTLQDQSELEVDFTLPARYAPQLRPGLAITLSVNAFPEQAFSAELVALDARVDPGTRNLLLRARLVESEGLLPGMFANLQVDLDRRTTVVTVPETAVTYSLQGNVVYVIEKNDEGGQTAVSRIVKVGQVRDGRASILEGLESGEQVVTVGQNKLFRGVTIVIDDAVDI